MTFQGSSRQFIFNRLHVVALHSHLCSVSEDLRNIPSFRTLRYRALKLKWKPWIASFHGKRGSEKLCFVNYACCWREAILSNCFRGIYENIISIHINKKVKEFDDEDFVFWLYDFSIGEILLCRSLVLFIVCFG